MNATNLTFLTVDGAVTVTFQPPLSPENYAELYDLMLGDIGSAADLDEKMRELARRWEVACIVDAC
jgi:hypothetical protein